MANTRELRRRIKSVKNTSQITRAMQMVAATKMRRAQNQAISGRPYLENLFFSLDRLLPESDPNMHPLLSTNNVKATGVILLSTDKGLVGALNTNLFRLLASNTGGWNVFYTVGKKGRFFVTKIGKDLKADFENLDIITFRQAKQLGKMILDSFLDKEIGQAFIVYPHFVSTLKQEARIVKILPVEVSSEERAASNEFLFEPSPDELIDYILVHSVHIKIYQALLEAKASEHSSRMVAMKHATDNARELIGDLTLSYNQTRQDTITREILEIASAGAAMS